MPAYTGARRGRMTCAGADMESHAPRHAGFLALLDGGPAGMIDGGPMEPGGVSVN